MSSIISPKPREKRAISVSMGGSKYCPAVNRILSVAHTHYSFTHFVPGVMLAL